MKYFDTYLIKSYIAAHKAKICCIICGYAEIWLQSTSVVFCNGNEIMPAETLNERIPNGTLRTPYMQVIHNDGTVSFIPCFICKAN